MTIGLLYHPRDRSWSTSGAGASILEHIARRHRRLHDVRPVTDPAQVHEVDLLVHHVDLTRTPAPFAQALASHPCTVNGRVLDISKRAVSDVLLAPDDEWPGPVIVKTDLNACGHPEERLLRGRVGRGWSQLRRKLESWTGVRRWAKTLRWGHYPVYERMGDVPSSAWRNDALVVERFVPEQVGEDFAIRSYVFMGDCRVAVRQISTDPVIKAASVIRREEVEVPPELEQRRLELGFDHGKFDYVMEDGVARLLDANRTPRLRLRSVWHDRLIDELASGLEPFLAAAGGR